MNVINIDRDQFHGEWKTIKSPLRPMHPTTTGPRVLPMLDDPDKTDRLIAELEASLPIEAGLSQTVKATLIEQSRDLVIPDRCHIARIFYAGDEGGIICGLDIGGPDTSTPYIVSITHLIFTRRSPLFRQIDAYQRHRIKKIKLQNSGDY